MEGAGSVRLANWLYNVAPKDGTAIGIVNRRSLIGVKPGDKGAVSLSLKEGGDQIEYEDQDPRIHKMWLDELKKNGVTPRMEKFFPNS